MTALAGAIDINLVRRGSFTLVEMGPWTPKIFIATGGLILVAVAYNYHVRCAFCIPLVFGTISWWIYTKEWPSQIVSNVEFEYDSTWYDHINGKSIDLTVSLIFLYVVITHGLVKTLGEMSNLMRDDRSIPRGRWIFIICGLSSVCCGMFSGCPILISPESTAGIEAGAKTGLSTVVCGLLFLLSGFCTPLLVSVPSVATSPVLMMVAVLIFRYTKKVEWSNISESIPAFCVLIFIPFTCNILCGVCMGYILYICIGILSGEFYHRCKGMTLQNMYSMLFYGTDHKDGYRSFGRKHIPIDTKRSRKISTSSNSSFHGNNCIEISERNVYQMQDELEDSDFVDFANDTSTLNFNSQSRFDFDASAQEWVSSDEDEIHSINFNNFD